MNSHTQCLQHTSTRVFPVKALHMTHGQLHFCYSPNHCFWPTAFCYTCFRTSCSQCQQMAERHSEWEEDERNCAHMWILMDYIITSSGPASNVQKKLFPKCYRQEHKRSSLPLPSHDCFTKIWIKPEDTFGASLNILNGISLLQIPNFPPLFTIIRRKLEGLNGSTTSVGQMSSSHTHRTNR